MNTSTRKLFDVVLNKLRVLGNNLVPLKVRQKQCCLFLNKTPVFISLRQMLFIVNPSSYKNNKKGLGGGGGSQHSCKKQIFEINQNEDECGY